MDANVMQHARAAAYACPLDQLDVSDPKRFRDDTIWPYFERLRKEDPVHYCKDSPFGSYWSVTRFKDILAVETNYTVFSSEGGAVSIVDRAVEDQTPKFISMDPPRHGPQRKTVSPMFTPSSLANLEGLIRSRFCTILDGLPRNETFNWVDKVSVELTTQMLATLFDFPFEDRHLLTHWSDVAVTVPQEGTAIDTPQKREAILIDCLKYFTRLWNERINQPPRFDLISMMAHSPATRNMQPREFLGNLILLIVGGNDTTRNSITGGLWFMDQNPDQLRKLRDSPKLIPSAVSEIIRYQTPLSHMRRTARQDVTFAGKQIKSGDKVILWYISGNRDDEAIERPNEFIIDRQNPRHHIAFGFGIHRCIGNRLAEMQLRIVWEEVLNRRLDEKIEVVGVPERVLSNFVHGYTALPVRIAA